MRKHRDWSPPRPGIITAVLVGAGVAWWPSMTPRGPFTAATVTVAAVATAYGLSRVLVGVRRPRPTAPTGWFPVAATVAVLAVAAALNLAWQNALRAGFEVATVGVVYWLTLVGSALITGALITWLPRSTAPVGAACAVTVCAVTLSAVLSCPGATAAASIGPDHRPTVDHRFADYRLEAETVVAAWRRDGGVRRDAVVIAVPTGSGWVDSAATDAIRDRFEGDVEVVSLAYADTASWRAFVTDPGAAGRSAVALLREVIDVVAAIPSPHERPLIYLYGQSLGAVGADTARAWADRQHPGLVAGTLLAGVPADSVADSVPGMDRTVLANASDPVTRWSIAALWRPPELPDDTRFVGAPAPTPPWLPVVSFLQSSIDLVTALDGPAGTGHRYGAEQGDLPGQPIGPRAASKAAPTR